MPAATQAWRTAVERIRLKKGAELGEYVSARPALERLVAIFGNNQTAKLLGVAPSQPSRWSKSDSIGQVHGRHVLDLDYIVSRLFQAFHADEVGPWLTYAQPFLNGARPIDVLVMQGPAPVIRAIDAIDQGGMV